MKKTSRCRFLLIVGLLMVRPVIVYKVTAFIAFFIIFFRKFLINLFYLRKCLAKTKLPFNLRIDNHNLTPECGSYHKKTR